ncbi:MAG: hypothetical protein CSA26_06315 [Desulfobacterales bacterium]|nr:MAG: hypothetical protein CSA26_06315 [Desulfobacterales bacterium]
MAPKKNAAGWVYALVCDREKDGHYLGLYSEDNDVNFIPIFETREEANDCFLSLPREKGVTYEVQAVPIEELKADADKNGFVVALFDGNGTIKK